MKYDFKHALGDEVYLDGLQKCRVQAVACDGSGGEFYTITWDGHSFSASVDRVNTPEEALEIQAKLVGGTA